MFSSQSYDMLSCTPPPAAVAVADRRWKPRVELAPNCPRCDSSNTKFCYYNNYSLNQPRYFCKGCRRYWTRGGSLRNVPVGGGCRKIHRGKAARLSTAAADPPVVAGRDVSLSRRTAPPAAAGAPPILPDLMLNDMARSPCMTQAAEEAAAIDLAVLYAKYLNQCPQVESSFAMPALPITEEVDHESIASVNGTPTQSSSCSQIPAQLPRQQAFLECQSPSQPTGEAQFSTEDYNILSMDLSCSLTLPMEAEAIDNCKSLDCPIGSNLLYQEFESGPVGSMNQYYHHQQNLVSDIDWSSLDYSSLEALYRC